MFGSRARAPRLLPALLLFTAGLLACADKPAGDLGFGVSFVCDADRERADALQLRVLTGGCDGNGEVRYEATLAKGESAPAANGIGPGTYGIEATASSAGEQLAYTCVVTELPSSASLELKLASDGCEASDAGAVDADMDAEVDAGDEDASTGDTGLDEDSGDADGDAEQDAEVDAAPIACSEDCDDDLPCTDDRCDTTSGICVHDQFTGSRECDGIACTQGDACESGVCAAGAPNDGACPDDGQVCTAEVCTPGTGCTSNTAGANGRTCSDNISCTGSDKCSNGVCRGTDTCAAGSVCSVGGSCVVTGCPTNCDDGNPCTDNVCSGGVCSNPANNGGCNDGKSCTANDVCSNKVCTGASICPSNATCGTACTCNAATDTLCDNTCVNLNTSTTNCGACGRACGSGQSCENGACKPGNANQSGCTAHRSGGHDYLFCLNMQTWTEARTTCRNWNMGLLIIDNATENTFVQQRIGESSPRWMGANDRGNNGGNCTKSEDEGTWFWANPTNNSDEGTQFCAFASSNASSCTATNGRYQNWKSGEPNNNNCSCIPFISCGEGEDCGSIQLDGLWNDSRCGERFGFVCESP